MSALAARRAAAAALAAESSSPAPSLAPSRASVRKTVVSQEATLISPGGSAVSESDRSDDGGFSKEAGPSKKRRVESSPKPRYFVPTQTEVGDVKTKDEMKKRTRRFSPSAPVSDVESGSDEGSSEESSEDRSKRQKAIDEVDEGLIRWSESTTPRLMPASRTFTNGTSSKQVDHPSSTPFVPQHGHTLHLISEEDLHKAGFFDSAGPGAVISLKPDESLTLAGVFSITPLQSPLTIFSTTLTPSSSTTSSYPVFAPVSHPLPVIFPASNQTKHPVQVVQLSKLELPETFASKDHTVFLLRENACGVDGLKAGVVPGFNNIWLEDTGPWKIRGLHPVLASFPITTYPHVTPNSWTTALSSLPSLRELASTNETSGDIEDPLSPCIALVKGPKRSGKSSFGRVAANKLLEAYERVAWLECDLGQGEFGCGGAVGIWIIEKPLLGPPFTHPAIPRRAHYIGALSPQSCPDEYLAAIHHLITYYRYELQYPSTPSANVSTSSKNSSIIPLVINTQGWVKGLGEDLLRAIETMSDPTHIFGFENPVSEEINGFTPGHGWTNSPPWRESELPVLPSDSMYGYQETGSHRPSNTKVSRHTLSPAPVSPLQARFTPADLRLLSMISYFHARLSSSPSISASWDFSTPLLAVPPWQVEVGRTIKRIIMAGEGSDGILEEDLVLALNGSIVALIEMTEESSSPSWAKVYEQSSPPPGLDESNFLGLALVRGVKPTNDPLQFTLHLLTPVPPETLAKATVLIKNGAMEFPTAGMLDWRVMSSVLNRDGEASRGLAGVNWEDVPFLDQSGSEGVGTERRRFRRNLMRKGI